MAAPFDFARLRPLQYDLNSAQGAIAFQRMVEVFMEAVRNNSGDLRGHDADIAKFCSMVNEDSGWQLAVNVVPEFRLSQSVLQS